MIEKKTITILGVSGSVGKLSLQLLLKRKDYIIKSIALKSNIFDKDIYKFLKKSKTLKYIYIENNDVYLEFMKDKISKKFTVLTFKDEESILDFISLSKTDYVLNALSGDKGVLPTLYCLKRKIPLFLANKESIVVSGEIIKNILKKYREEGDTNTYIYPLDSEHAALYKLLKTTKREDVEEIYLTCSGGPFFDLKEEELKNVTLKEALNHPNFKMGKKITIDSSTLMNKAFEVVEAYYFFDFDPSLIKVKIDRTSRCHSFIKLKNGTYKLSIGEVSMRQPIEDCLNLFSLKKKEKEFKDTYIKSDISKFGFKDVDLAKFPLFELGYKIIENKGIYGLVISEANEAAVNLFLEEKITYIDIKRIIDKILEVMNDEKKSLIRLDFVLEEENILKLMKLVRDKASYIGQHLELF